MWMHRSWQGRFTSSRIPAGEKLRSYAGWCDAVEGNTTFYATPSRNTVESWARQTPEDFRFVLKLPKPVTHERRMTGAEDVLHPFLDAIEPLGPRAHALWVQLPGSFGPLDLALLSGFLRSLPRSYRLAVEVRHRAFFEDARSARLLEQVLGETGAEWVPFDTVFFFTEPPTTAAEREGWERKPRMPRRTRALTDRPIIRYLGRDDAERTAASWGPWVDVVAGWLREGRSPTFFLHTPDNTEAPALARRFHDDVRVLVPDLDPLPEPLIDDEPLTLF